MCIPMSAYALMLNGTIIGFVAQSSPQQEEQRPARLEQRRRRGGSSSSSTRSTAAVTPSGTTAGSWDQYSPRNTSGYNTQAAVEDLTHEFDRQSRYRSLARHDDYANNSTSSSTSSSGRRPNGVTASRVNVHRPLSNKAYRQLGAHAADSTSTLSCQKQANKEQ